MAAPALLLAGDCLLHFDGKHRDAFRVDRLVVVAVDLRVAVMQNPEEGLFDPFLDEPAVGAKLGDVVTKCLAAIVVTHPDPVVADLAEMST